MHIKSFEIEGLLGRPEPVRGTLDKDLVLFTGRNGAGKTSVLKLLWSVVSGNILIGLQEVEFRRLRVVTDKYDCTVQRLSRMTCRVEIVVGDTGFLYEDEEDDDGDVIENAEDQARAQLIQFGSSVFFPTFRRIEGGFSIRRRTGPSSPFSGQSRTKSDIEEALLTLSRRLTNDPHTFVSAISTSDIVTFLLRKYADLSDEANQRQAATSQDVMEAIKALDWRPMQSQGEQLENATKTIEEVRSRIETMESDRKAIMAPFEAVKSTVERLFKGTGIEIGSRVSFGDAATAVDSDRLSAGEKQMLSFVCYNAFYKDSIFFIDEPELSLHPDWQRQLFVTLQSQQSSNQFIVATHSPFIYAKYPDKEVEIVPDRGDTPDGLGND